MDEQEAPQRQTTSGSRDPRAGLAGGAYQQTKLPWRYRFPSAQTIAWWAFAVLCLCAATWLLKH